MITKHVATTDGTVYLRTQQGESSEEIAEALKPYIGQVAHFYPPNLYGHINIHRATRGEITAVEGTEVSFYVASLDYTGTVDAFEGFGSYCTMIDPKEEQA